MRFSFGPIGDSIQPVQKLIVKKKKIRRYKERPPCWIYWFHADGAKMFGRIWPDTPGYADVVHWFNKLDRHRFFYGRKPYSNPLLKAVVKYFVEVEGIRCVDVMVRRGKRRPRSFTMERYRIRKLVKYESND